MLELKKISKSYTTGDFTQTALNEVSLKFRTNEFVAILGPSGSGKTTLLNIVGGLDRYDTGDLVINGKSTKDFNDREWDAYRNNCVGFVFQSYNLISHISVLGNVEMGMTLSGVSASERKKKALSALERVGLKEHAHKKPNQLSGGQMQRVAIARALVNDPDIILADEPTGALDTKTSEQIMELIKDIAKDKLVIMVTHNPDIANNYANRIVNMRDGIVQNDTNPLTNDPKTSGFNIRKTSMSFFTALNLSFNNIRTKKGRTLLTSFAASIGIIGIALILSLSNGFDIQIAKFEKDTLSSMPIMISEQAMELSEDRIAKIQEENKSSNKDYPDALEVYPKDSMQDTYTHTNVMTKEYIEYLKKIDTNLISGMSFMSATNLNIITKTHDDKYTPVTSNIFGNLPQKDDKNDPYEFMENTYDVIAGNYPKSKEDLVLIIDIKNNLDKNILTALGFDPNVESINFDDIIGKELKLIKNDSYYQSLGKIYTFNTDYKKLYDETDSITLKISGIIRGKEGKEMITSFSSGVAYTTELIEYVVKTNADSSIVKAQKQADYNILSGEVFVSGEEEKTLNNLVSYLGGDSTPFYVQVFSKDFETKDKVLEYLDAYNEGKEVEDKIVYTDMGNLLSTLSGNIMSAITVVLIAFSAISLIVSTIMIAIITYISVLERTKEIGILRALGARKKDITRVFNAETFIIGASSGILGILIARLMLIPANAILLSLTDLENVAVLNPVHAMMLITISVILTLIGGFIPAKMAAKKDPVIALRTE